MFSISIRKKLIQRLRAPIRENVLRSVAAELMKGTRYQSQINFTHALLNENVIRKQTLKALNGKTISLYSSHPLEEISPHELALSMFPNGYFCNLTAIFHHGLIDQVPNTVYICHETIQAKKKGSPDTLSESRVRSAFIQPHRHTQYVFGLHGHELVILDREKNSDYGVDTVQKDRSPCPVGSRVAGLERSLIDAVVAPQYNGGITSLPSYFKAAQGKLKIELLLEIYRKLRLIYPYAQSIGFLLEKTGIRAEADQVRKAYPPRLRFFLDHNAKTSWDYNDKWMIAYPKGLIDEN